MRLIWTEPALRDLRSARAYIAQDNPDAAIRQVALVVAAADRLLRFPEMGRPGRRAGTRELVVGKTPFIVPYRLALDSIDILRVLHSRQQWPEGL